MDESFHMHLHDTGLTLAALAKADGSALAVPSDKLKRAVSPGIFGNAGHDVIFPFVLPLRAVGQSTTAGGSLR